jgi:hypothetical protein
MKNLHTLFFTLLITSSLFAQSPAGPNKVSGGPQAKDVSYSQCTEFSISRPLIDLAAEQAAGIKRANQNEVEKPRQANRPHASGVPQGMDPAIQASPGVAAITPPLVNFTAQSGNGYPLDPTGAAGLTAYVQAVNTNYQAFNKSTGAPLMASLQLNNLWPGSVSDGDPIVLYDKYADRWFIQQFQQNGNKILIAISTSNDPTGTFYQYTFVPDAADFPDYPKFSIWPDGYYMTANFTNPKVTVFDRVKMLAGNSSAGMIVKAIPPLNVSANNFFVPITADADGSLPPFGTPIPLLYFEDDNWGAPATKDQIHIFNFSPNWTTPAASTLVENVGGGSPLATAPFNSTFNATSMDEISQKSNTQHLDAIAGIFMFRAQYRVWTGYNSLVLNNVVNADGNGKAGIRWYELRQDASSGMWSIYQQGTYSPDGDNRWMGSIAMDDNGRIGLAYSVSGVSTDPSLRYTGRYPTDPLGVMTCTEQTAVAGTGAQTGINRWGDYGHTAIDPDGHTFWHTGMWNSAANGEQTQVFSFQITGATGIANKTNGAGGEFSVYQSPNNLLVVKGSQLNTNESLQVDLFDIQGKAIHTHQVQPASQRVECSFDVSGLSKGTYLVRIGNAQFQKIIKCVLN